jgi:hypothetical protein
MMSILLESLQVCQFFAYNHLRLIERLDSVCSTDSSCAGYPLAFCEGVCKCREGALNAGSTCVTSENGPGQAASCPSGQAYVSEVGTCLAGNISFFMF